jgi:RNA polymerase sigma-70 factor (ECF subfamily)
MALPDTRLSLIAKLQGSRNEAAWWEFVSVYEPFLQRLVARQGVPQRHVADVTQQVLAAIVRSVDAWRGDGDPASFRRWVGRVARNVVIKFLTRERRQPTAEGGTDIVELLHQVADEPSVEDCRRYDLELISWAAEQVRSEFRETSWRAFQATLVEGREATHVARELNVTPGSIYMSRSRIMARIRAKVAEAMGEPEP